MKHLPLLTGVLTLTLATGVAFAQLPNLPLNTENTCEGFVEAARQGRDPGDATADGVFWPPNHKLRGVTITAENQDGDACNVTITDVRQDEPVTGLGSGNFSPDAANCSNAGNASSVDLRGERAGTGTGRYYTIAYTMQDPDYPGAAKADTAVLLVPHDQGLAHVGTYLNEGPLFASYEGAALACAQ